MASKRIDSVMALKRALSHRSFFSARCYQPSHNGDILPNHANAEKRNCSSFLHQRSFGSPILSQHLRSSSHLSLSTPFGVSTYHRSMSTAHVPGSDENDVTGTLTDSVLPDVSAQTTTVIKVYGPGTEFFADGIQHIIGNVHSFTGLNWWASIVLTTLLIRGLTVPLLIHSEKCRARQMMLITESTAIEDIKDQGGDSAALAKRQSELDKLEKKYGSIGIFYPIWVVLQRPVLDCMSLAVVINMTKEESFKTGGALWFTDLTTQDPLFIFPLLTGMTFWITVKCDAVVGFEGTLFLLRKLAPLGFIFMVFVGMLLPQAVHCCWMSSMLASIAFIHVIRHPGVRKYLGVPHVPEDVILMSFKWKTIKKLLKMFLGDLKMASRELQNIVKR